ncbi:cytochrome P450 [Streptomyces millisiae]|uniref:Cytochrome P450 n=1 Tax=Streptomyces millisiae TaxID=3075542 RepID=A0ABU2LX84_9ACTN|nr:cytochrome P450 [Streptomyces sp. DSM 44918]MDT0321888.1 cytochrome P450 [Streptomyces sp. DSM 44918]
MTTTAHTSDLDLFSDETLADPYPLYAQLRDLDSAVYMERLGVWAVGRHEDVRAALKDPVTFGSEGGVALTDAANQQILAGTVLASDGDHHRRLRRVLARQLGQPAIAKLTDLVRERAQQLVGQAVEHGTFDAVDLARRMVADTVMELMGLPDSTRQTVLDGAAPTFDCFGPANQRFLDAAPAAAAMVAFLHKAVTRTTVRPGSWMAGIYEAVDAGALGEHEATPLMSAYTAAGMDTTILGIASTIHLLSTHPEQWALVREDRTRFLGTAGNAFHEALRLEAPVQGFGRRVTTETTIGDTRIGPGQQVWLLYGSAGRDPRRWDNPDRFDVRRRDANQHLSLGAGPHACAGNHLAELQATALVEALAARCRAVEPAGAERGLNNVLRGWRRLPVTITLDDACAA